MKPVQNLSSKWEMGLYSQAVAHSMFMHIKVIPVVEQNVIESKC